ncbi:MAG: hypothetical protein KGI50_08205 [Patescibacteria group bacterium]|nr:hypothetical protein [Patescibacteria group bacterium]MDE2439374.1 hypothetical protein [Patescibacteria group bacterium]
MAETDYAINAGYYNAGSNIIQDWISDRVYLVAGFTTNVGLAQFQCNQANGATISSAVFSSLATANGVPITIYGVKQANTAWPETAAFAAALPLTTASVSYTSNSGIDTVSVASIIQEIVNQGGWVAGNDLMLVFKTTSTTLQQSWDSNGADSIITHRPTLTIGGGGSGGSGGSGGQKGPNATTLLLQLMRQRTYGF